MAHKSITSVEVLLERVRASEERMHTLKSEKYPEAQQHTSLKPNYVSAVTALKAKRKQAGLEKALSDVAKEADPYKLELPWKLGKEHAAEKDHEPGESGAGEDSEGSAAKRKLAPSFDPNDPVDKLYEGFYHPKPPSSSKEG